MLFIAPDSTPLVEKLLNDYLKATEAFNKLKKMNDQLKGQIGQETGYVSLPIDFAIFFALNSFYLEAP